MELGGESNSEVKTWNGSRHEYWLGREVLERGIAAVYLIAFVAAAKQFRALIGERHAAGAALLARQSFLFVPSVFHFHSDRFFAGICWFGAAMSAGIVAGVADLVPLWAAMMMWLVLWVLYLSIVNVGQAWYSFGWESLLREAGFLAIFLGNDSIAPPVLVMWLARWLLFRVEFGAGLIKLRGDTCWRDLTCLYYHHETQPMPGPLSWFFHHLPKPLHRVEVAGNHFAQLVVPIGLFAPQPVASVAAAIIVITQLWLVLSGNFAWLNWVTIILALSVIDASSAAWLLPMPEAPALPGPPPWFVGLVVAVAVLEVFLSYWPVRNLISHHQRMNASFNPFHLVNTYGAFGGISRTRQEVVIEGTDEEGDHRSDGVEEYGFKGKPVPFAGSAAVGPVPSAPGLAHVVRRDLAALRPAVAGPVPRAAAGERSGDTSLAPAQSVPDVPTAVCARPALSVSLPTVRSCCASARGAHAGGCVFPPITLATTASPPTPSD